VSTPQTAQRLAVSERLKTREYIGYALGDTASNFFFQTFNIFLTYYYVDVWGIPATALLWMMPIVRFIGAFDDPIMGLIADRTQTRLSRKSDSHRCASFERDPYCGITATREAAPS
jgi:Na+/melibiose symporter-like transporter